MSGGLQNIARIGQEKKMMQEDYIFGKLILLAFIMIYISQPKILNDVCAELDILPLEKKDCIFIMEENKVYFTFSFLP
jgi:hypothetical protein